MRGERNEQDQSKIDTQPQCGRTLPCYLGHAVTPPRNFYTGVAACTMQKWTKQFFRKWNSPAWSHLFYKVFQRSYANSFQNRNANFLYRQFIFQFGEFLR